jgi:hypothetical protein
VASHTTRMASFLPFPDSCRATYVVSFRRQQLLNATGVLKALQKLEPFPVSYAHTSFSLLNPLSIIMPFFNGAKGVNVNGGQMNDVAGDLTNNVTVIKSHRIRSDNQSTSSANNNTSSGTSFPPPSRRTSQTFFYSRTSSEWYHLQLILP